ncbi:polyprenyl synthetase family protein [Stieleria mannarensis]|uniref:polyprenyl synthetase family protein n=1 Tax=Stieleria mannarensis TaxID=2755585 RepID=UPI0025712732|nr:polyprenyl synthetase family protein [Rhodopirellula sp. JC639]
MPASPIDRTEPHDTEPSIDRALGDLLPAIEQALRHACSFGNGCPDRLADAIRYALLAPGKRLRPALVLMAAEACGGSFDDAMPGAVAVEMVHAYSLIHDDLPAMDDDDLRRGRPTVHLAFDEATAILAGDALQPLAFSHLCRSVADPLRRGRAVEILAAAAGPEQLVGGQADDLAAESGQLPEAVAADLKQLATATTTEPSEGNRRTPKQHASLAFLESIHRRKTGALFSASLQLGAALCGADERQSQALAAFAADLGLAFQVVDDLLDHTADESSMGKRVGKDSGRGKLTYPGLLGLDQAQTFASDLVQSAKSHLAVFEPSAWRLEHLADYVLARPH